MAAGSAALSTLLVGLGYLSVFLPGEGLTWGPWVFVGGTVGLLTSLIFLGANGANTGRRADGDRGNGSRGEGDGPEGGTGRTRLLALVGVLWLILLGGFGVVLALPSGEAADATLWLGLPPRAAVVVVGVGLLPVLFVPLVYAWTFPELGLEREDLERIREAAESARREKE